MSRIWLIPLLLILTFTSRAQSKTERRLDANAQGEIQLSGAFALYPMVVRWAEEFRKLYPNVKIDISAGGAGKGITDALTGMVDLGMVSREVHQAELDKGAFVIAVAKDAVIPTINSQNPLIRDILYRGLTREAAIGIWVTRTVKTWGQAIGTNNKIPMHTYTRSDACGAAETWAAWLGKKQEDLEGTAVFGDPGVASVVQNDKLAIGFNNLAYAYDMKTRRPYRHILVLPLDIDGNGRIDLDENFYSTSDDLSAAIADGRYPMPPARQLYVVSNGCPTKPEVVAFLQFILNEGQNYTSETGYIGLSTIRLDEELDKLF